MIARRLLLLLVGTALVVAATASFAFANQSTSQANSTGTVVVLVDLSGSLSAEDVAEEVRAVGIMNTAPGIDLYVIGFASEGTLPAFQVACEPGDDLADCTESLVRRSNAEGNDTDHAAALAGAGTVLGPADPEKPGPRIVLLLTDGDFDPSGSGTPTASELSDLSDARDHLRSEHVSVWPLGFGRATKKELNALAIAGPDACRTPRGILIEAANEVPAQVNRIIGLTTCAETFRGDRITVLPDTDLLIVTYGQEELQDGSVIVQNDSGDRARASCSVDDVAGVWTCEIPTTELGSGTWRITPAPREFRTPYQQVTDVARAEPTTTVARDRSTTTSSRAESTTTSSQASPSTTIPSGDPGSVDAAAANDEGSGIPLVWVAAGVLGVGILVGVFVWSRRD